MLHAHTKSSLDTRHDFRLPWYFGAGQTVLIFRQILEYVATAEPNHVEKDPAVNSV
jgi:hypothetical protein